MTMINYKSLILTDSEGIDGRAWITLSAFSTFSDVYTIQKWDTVKYFSFWVCAFWIGIVLVQKIFAIANGEVPSYISHVH